MDNQNTDKILRELMAGMKSSQSKCGNLSEADIKSKIKTVDKNAAINKLNSLGMGSIAGKLKNMSDDDIMREISKNPSIIKKLNKILNG